MVLSPLFQVSPPSRRRGLKFVIIQSEEWNKSRLLHGGVDWNRRESSLLVMQLRVASFTEAWIGIRNLYLHISIPKVASFTEAWIEITIWILLVQHLLSSPPSRRRGLKYHWYHHQCLQVCRLLHGGVDWNTIYSDNCSCCSVASFTEAWIEIEITHMHWH